MKRVEDRQLVQALVKLETDPELAPFREWIRESLREEQGNMRVCADETALRWEQGSAQTLHEIEQQIASARDTLKRIREQ